MQNRLICITGPTASGKTALSIALAQRLQTEIISSDSMQIYREMDIGTAKPTAAEQAAVPHHMIDIVDPGEPFSVARYVELADQCAQTLLQAGKIPLVVGGTGLYLDALIEGSAFPGDETDRSYRTDRLRTGAWRPRLGATAGTVPTPIRRGNRWPAGSQIHRPQSCPTPRLQSRTLR